MGEYMTTAQVGEQAGIKNWSVITDIKKGLLPGQWNNQKRVWEIPTSEVPSYLAIRQRMKESISIDEFTRRTMEGERKVHRWDEIKQAIQNGDLTAPRYGDNTQYFILETEAKEFSQRMGWTYTIPTKKSKGRGRPFGSTTSSASTIANNGHINNGEKCDACGSGRGNIIGDMNKTTHERYGFLCTECHRLLVASNANIDRLHKLLTYIEKTRESQVYLVHT